MKKTIPVVYATDAGYLPYTVISMWSAMNHASIDHFYRFVILVPSNWDSSCESDIKSIFSDYTNCSVEFMVMGDIFENITMRLSHVTSPTYYRLLIDSYLPEYDKCVYIDGDTLIRCDIAELYDVDMGDYLLAGVPSHGNFLLRDQLRENLGFDSDRPFTYINAGVLVMNLGEIRKKEMQKVFLQLLDRDFKWQDQDILNYACVGSIYPLPMRYNLTTNYYYMDVQPEVFSSFYSAEEVTEALANPAIVHFADRFKPWNSLAVKYAPEWIQTAYTGKMWDYYGKYHHKEYLELTAADAFKTAKENRQYKAERKQLKQTIKDLRKENKEIKRSLAFRAKRFLARFFRKIIRK